MTVTAGRLCHNIAVIIYVDVLIFINTVLNYAVLATADALLKRRCMLRRLLVGALIGALFSLTVFLDIDGGIILFLIRVLSSAIITAVTFGFKEYIKTALMTLCVSLLYCGGLILFWQIFKPPDMLIINDIPYFRIDPLLMLGLTAVIYLILLICVRLFRERIKTTIVPLCFSVNGKEYSCIGKIDTACDLTEPFSRAPVIIADSTVFTLSDSIPARIIPYTTVSGSSYLRAVPAQKVTIDKKPAQLPVYIAAAPELNTNFHAIINSEIIR